MTELDDMALSMLCQAWVDYLASTDQVKKSRMQVKSQNAFSLLNSSNTESLIEDEPS